MSISTRLWTVVFLALLTDFTAADDNWPRFRGAGGSGIGDDRPLPTEWDTKTNVLWSVDVPGRGWSSPIIWGDSVFVTAVLNDKTPLPRKGLYIQDLLGKIPPGEHVWKLYCHDFDTGKLRWERTLHKGTPGGPIHLKNTYASETPVTDGQHVYVYIGNLGVYCYDMDGNQKWSKPIAPQKTRMGWGTGSSPVVHEDRLYLVNDNEEASYLLALDKHTGKEVWRVERDEASTWGTPLIWQNKLRTEIVTAGTRGVRSYDLTGKLLWELKGMSSISIPSPFAHNELVYVTSGYLLDPQRPLYAIKQGAAGVWCPTQDHRDWTSQRVRSAACQNLTGSVSLDLVRSDYRQPSQSKQRVGAPEAARSRILRVRDQRRRIVWQSCPTVTRSS
jgi:outer membrane protein assembly factor BamB